MTNFSNDDFWKPVVTTRQIIQGEDIIVCVSLDMEGDWEALGNEEFSDDDLDVLSVEEMLQLDPTLASLPEMECGQVAVRDGKEAPWQVEDADE